MNDSNVAAGQSDHPAPCALCHQLLPSSDEHGDFEAISICGDCKFLFLEDHGTPMQDNYRTRVRGLRRRRYRSSEPIESLFSQQFSHIINQARQNQAPFVEHDNRSIDGDAATMLVQLTSSRTTPSGSRRWRRVLSDTESDGFDSLFGEGESNVSLSGSRYFYGESDSISFSAYGGESDISMDDHSFLENENYGHTDLVSDHDTDTDIDPMHAGLYHWNSDDLEEEDEDQYVNWEETDAEENMVATVGTGSQPGISFNPLESNDAGDGQQAFSPQFEGTNHLRIQERRRGRLTNLFANLEEPAGPSYVGNYVDYVRGRGFEELLEHLAESESSRRGAPPAAVSVVSNLPNLVIGEGLEKLDDLACAICKDSLHIGTVVNQLPCFHLYHPSCILPWLSSRNSCPLCRYELPTDDKDYENRKQRSSTVLDFQEYQQQDMNGDSSSDETDGAEAEFDHNRMEVGGQGNVNLVAENSRSENARRGWVFLAAAAPIVGIILVFCLGNCITERRWPSSRPNFSGLGRHPSHCLLTRNPIPGDSGRNRRWWCPF
ncbi:hypothetical protein ACH5RR_005102 [Cinchona calisaya]|uniref:RING-type E3 ubiquitin transferase n=1 Tax=Cinchona calisaya TaxID=153742 RepID=A0ABD3AKA5_9GENT